MPPARTTSLKEAEVLANGNSLGPVGSRIVAETLIGQLRADAESFLNAPAPWSPEQGVLLPDGSPIVSINDLFPARRRRLARAR